MLRTRLLVLGTILAGMGLVSLIPTAAAADQCDYAVVPFDESVERPRWVRVEVRNRGAPIDIELCVVEPFSRVNRDATRETTPAMDVFQYTFNLPGERWGIVLSAGDQLASGSVGNSVRLDECDGVIWRPSVLSSPGSVTIDQGTTECVDEPNAASPRATVETPAEPAEPKLRALAWEPVVPVVAPPAPEEPIQWQWGALSFPLLLVPRFRHALWFLFTRLVKPELLDQTYRARIMDLIEAQPGIHFEELSRTLELGNGVTRHHLAVLLRHKLIVDVRFHGKRCIFPASAGPRPLLVPRAALRQEPARKVFEAVRDGPKRLPVVASETGLSESQARRWLHDLSQLGMVESHFQNGQKFFRRGTVLA